jgi:hypothetical protein
LGDKPSNQGGDIPHTTKKYCLLRCVPQIEKKKRRQEEKKLIKDGFE